VNVVVYLQTVFLLVCQRTAVLTGALAELCVNVFLVADDNMKLLVSMHYRPTPNVCSTAVELTSDDH